MLQKSSLSRISLGRMLLLAFLVIAGLPAMTGVLGWVELQKVARNQSKVTNETIPAISEVRGFTEESSRIVAVAPELAAVTIEAARRERAAFLFAQVNALSNRVSRYESTGNVAPPGLARAEADVRRGIERLDRLVQDRIIAISGQKSRLLAGLGATTELLEIADTLVANAQMGTAAVISNLYDLENADPDTNMRLETLDKLIEVDLFRQGLDIPRVALMTGHKTWAQLKRYTNIKPADVHQTLADRTRTSGKVVQLPAKKTTRPR